jgi:glycine oxidase
VTRVGVVGGGVIGLAVAYRLRERGCAVTVYDPAPGTGASDVAAGMLAPAGEAAFGEGDLAALLAESARRWPAFAASLHEATGLDVGYRADGTLLVARTGDDLAELDRLLRLQSTFGLAPQPLRTSELREREPLLSPRLRGGALVSSDAQVDPRRVVAALLATGIPVVRRHVPDLSTVDSTVDEDVLVVAAGCGSAELAGLPVRPVKGQLLRLRGPAALRHTVRGYADGCPVYAVPRTDGEVVVGATNEERTDATVTAGAVLDLLRAAVELVPALAEYALTETRYGFRPGTPDNAPCIGWLRPGVLVATGHYRNGVLLAPVTADAVADLVLGGPDAALLAPFAPGRFAGAAFDVTGAGT